MVNTFENHKELEKTYRELLDKPTFQFPERGKSFLDIAGFPHREKVWSNFYAFFLDQKQEHGLGKLFLSCLIDILVEKTSNEFQPDFFQEFDVELEYPIPNGFIDILLAESDDQDLFLNAIIIENKVIAPLKNDLENYYEQIKVTGCKIGVLLTLYPNEDLPQGFVSITHKELAECILSRPMSNWLSSNYKTYYWVTEFLNNILSNYTNPHMKEALEFAITNKDKIRGIIDLKSRLIEALLDKTVRALSHYQNFKKGKFYYDKAYVDFKSLNLKYYLYYRFDGLLSGKPLEIELWIRDEAVSRWQELPVDIRHQIQKEFKDVIWNSQPSSKFWWKVANRAYQNISPEELDNLEDFLKHEMDKIWNPIIERIKNAIRVEL